MPRFQLEQDDCEGLGTFEEHVSIAVLSWSCFMKKAAAF
jgi:hypothetical protein